MTAPARLLAALLALLLWAGIAPAQTFPKFTGLVVDAANVLPADRRAALEAKLAAFQQRTKRQLVVATLPDLQGYPLADYGYRLGRAWGVGLADVNNGALLLIAPNEPAGQRGPRIEVGYGLEPVLTDALSAVIIRRDMMPRLKAGDVPGALDAGADAIMAQLRLPDDEAKARVDAAVKEFDRTHARRGGGEGAGVAFGVIFWALVVGLLFLAHRRRSAGSMGARRYDGAGSTWPVWLWAASEMMSGHDRDRGGGGTWGGGGDWGGSAGGSDGSWGGGGFTGGGGGSFGGGGASGDW